MLDDGVTEEAQNDGKVDLDASAWMVHNPSEMDDRTG